MKKKLTLIPVLLWAVLAVCAWFGPVNDFSDGERRPLAQMPEVSSQTILSGSFMEKFEDFSLDQFPLRDGFRKIKSLFHYYVLGQKDNNGIYIADGYAVQQEYPLDEDSLEHALERFDRVYEKYLSGSKVYVSIVPDKGYYLAAEAGQLAMDYEDLFARMQAGMPYAAYIDITGALSGTSYYRTDTHWRQEHLLDAATVLCKAMGVTAPKAEDYTAVTLDRPFYGVYYGQAALPMEPEQLSYLQSALLKDCTVYDFESGKTGPVYDLTKAEGKDLYEVFLTGPRSLLTIENPNAPGNRELIIFRDSFGSAMAPLLLQDYARVTLVDIRYIQMDVLERFVEFQGQDVLFLYSTLVLNNSETIK